MNILVAVTGASGAIYAQRLLDALHASGGHNVHIMLSTYARQVIAEEIGELRVPPNFVLHGDKSMNVPFASGSSRWDRMVIIPCTMGTVGRIAHGTSDSTITRTADVFLKERRKLIIVPRETPWNLIHARNIVTLLEAGADVIPAMPSFYSQPQTIMDVVDTVVARVLDHMDVPHSLGKRWMDDGMSPDATASPAAMNYAYQQQGVTSAASGHLHAPVTGRRGAAHPPQRSHPQQQPPMHFGGYVSARRAAESAGGDDDIDNRRAGGVPMMMQIIREDDAPAPPAM
ncbi:MAG TPA: UbiX family flavin prenyltransferase, partial [Candidatus Methylacidiphilales bacterium]|nr:UbiX family flavin prenyltransferase [Candidatus Methylacidiphilales bacterium]